MIWQNEVRGDRVPVPVPPGSLIEFLAIRLILDRLAVAYVAGQSLGYTRAAEGSAFGRPGNVDQA